MPMIECNELTSVIRKRYNFESIVNVSILLYNVANCHNSKQHANYVKVLFKLDLNYIINLYSANMCVYADNFYYHLQHTGFIRV